MIDSIVEDGELAVGSLQMDLAAHAARLDGEPLPLSPKQYSLLLLLARNAGKVLTHQRILDLVWDRSQSISTLRAHVLLLRRQLEASPTAPQIITAPGVGYRLVDREGGPGSL
jgi:two-component system KDP operon response regulator KdpE